jgi:biotin carboxyl carrier protein/surface antigen
LALADVECRSTAAIVELVEKMQSEPDLSASCQCLADHLQQLVPCRQVIVGVCGGRKRSCRVMAISGSLDIDTRSQRIRSIEAAMDESIVRQSLTVWPSPDDSERHALLANRRLAESTSSGSVVSSPVRDGEGRVTGACVFLGEEALPDEPHNLNLIRAAERPVGSCLALQQRAERGRLHRFLSHVAGLPRQWPGRVGLAAALLVAGLMMVPFSYKVKCNCELQPVTRRFVAAPFEGTLERSLVEPGDLVAEDQLLALIDGREIRWELAGILADLNRAAKKRDGHLASHEFGEAKLSQYEVERLQIKSELLEHRSNNLEVRSPIAGIVIAGDLKKTEGAPLRVGQTMYEIAPLDRMIVEVAVPEEDIRWVTPGLSVDLTLEGFPGEHWQGDLVRIHPRSEVKDDEHVFIGEMELTNTGELLRPGMQGRVRITSRRRPLGWILLHRPWDKLVFWLGW